MKWNGIDVQLANHLGWRQSNPEFDFNLDGEPVESNYVSIVKLKDCRIETRDEKQYYDPTCAPNIPINHGGTNYGYGKWRKRHSDMGVWIDNKLYHDYWTVPMYVVYDAKVYQGSIRHAPKKCSCGFVGNKLEFREHIHTLTGKFEGTEEHHKVEEE